MDFSQDKQDMLPVLTDMFVNDNKELLRIQGPPGCGKTTVIEMIVNHFLSLNQLQTMIDPLTQKLSSANVFLSATTNKAAAVIEEEVCPNLEPKHGAMTAGTIYQLLSLKVFNDYKTGRTKVMPNKYASSMTFPKGSLIIIDEASYTDFTLWRYIEERLLGLSLNVILIADYYQSSPVNCNLSPIFNPNIPVYTLTERFRYPVGSAIHQNSLLCEKAIDTGVVDRLTFDETCERITSQQLPALLKEHMIDNDYNTKLLAYRNDTVVDYNNQICRKKYGGIGFHVGQEVVFNKFYKFGDYVFFNEQKAVITEIGAERDGIHGVRVNDMKLKGFGDTRVPVAANHKQFNAALRKAKSEADWPTFYQLQEQIVDLRHAWASTVHKSQGSTYDYVILDFNDLLGVTNMALFYRLLNVALTRPRKKVFICKD